MKKALEPKLLLKDYWVSFISQQLNECAGWEKYHVVLPPRVLPNGNISGFTSSWCLWFASVVVHLLPLSEFYVPDSWLWIYVKYLDLMTFTSDKQGLYVQPYFTSPLLFLDTSNTLVKSRLVIGFIFPLVCVCVFWECAPNSRWKSKAAVIKALDWGSGYDSLSHNLLGY